MLEAKNLSKIYLHPIEPVRVFNNLSLKVEKGQSLAIVGESGRGKTTLLYSLSGLDRLDGGEIWINSERIDHLSETKLSRFRSAHFGFVFQHHFLLNDLTALENALLPLRITNSITQEKIDYVEHLFERLNLAHRLHHQPEEMSGGECQRASVIRALANKPLVIFADEPTGSLDSNNAHLLEELLFELIKEYQTTLIISTHNERLAKYCDRMETIDRLEQAL
ncbi:MAG: ABC transporter ATP-binding protein [Brevinema sp.]